MRKELNMFIAMAREFEWACASVKERQGPSFAEAPKERDRNSEVKDRDHIKI